MCISVLAIVFTLGSLLNKLTGRLILSTTRAQALPFEVWTQTPSKVVFCVRFMSVSSQPAIANIDDAQGCTFLVALASKYLRL